MIWRDSHGTSTAKRHDVCNPRLATRLVALHRGVKPRGKPHNSPRTGPTLLSGTEKLRKCAQPQSRRPLHGGPKFDYVPSA